MLHLLGFPKAKPESCPGYLYCLASRWTLQSSGAGGPRRSAWQAPDWWVVQGLDRSQPVYFCLPPSGIERRDGRWDISELMRNMFKRRFNTEIVQELAKMVMSSPSTLLIAQKDVCKATLLNSVKIAILWWQCLQICELNWVIFETISSWCSTKV